MMTSRASHRMGLRSEIQCMDRQNGALASFKDIVGGGTTEVNLMAKNCLKIYLLPKE